MTGEPARLSIEIPRDLHNRMNNFLPYGVKSLVIRKVLEMITDALEKNGEIFIGAVLADNIKLEYHPQERSKNERSTNG